MSSSSFKGSFLITDFISGSSEIGVGPRERVRIFSVLIGRRFAEVLRSAEPAEIGRLSVFGSSFLITGFFLMMGSFLITAFLVLFFWLRFGVGVADSCEASSRAGDDGGALGWNPRIILIRTRFLLFVEYLKGRILSISMIIISSD
jgi:hypothetical protein